MEYKKLLPVRKDKELKLKHFPTKFHLAVFRFWETVDVKRIAKALLTDKSFTFDDANDVRAIYYDKTRIGNYLNYRSFYSILRNCDGTKKDYLEALSFSGLSKTKVTMIKNILATYTDKVTVGNMLFNKNTSAVRTKKAAQEVAAALDQLERELD